MLVPALLQPVSAVHQIRSFAGERGPIPSRDAPGEQRAAGMGDALRFPGRARCVEDDGGLIRSEPRRLEIVRALLKSALKLGPSLGRTDADPRGKRPRPVEFSDIRRRGDRAARAGMLDTVGDVAAVSMSMQGIGIAPSLRQPSMAICHSGRRGSMTMTRSPRPMPSDCSRLAQRLESRLMSAKVKRRSSTALVAPDQRKPCRVARQFIDDVAAEVEVRRHLPAKRR